MFAYCLNNPVNAVDPNGTDCTAIPINDTIPCGGPIPIPSLKELFQNFLMSIGVLSTTASLAEGLQVRESTQSSEESQSLVTEDSFPIFIGCRLINHKIVLQTPPMGFWESYVWALTRKADPSFGKGTSWGLLTISSKNAEIMAKALGCQAEPVWHKAHYVGYYDHYHVSQFKFLNYYKRFHVWYM